MVSSPNYDRLKILQNLSEKPLASGDYQEDSRSGNAHTAVTEVKDKGEDFQNDESVGQSQTKEGADSWMGKFVDDSNEHMTCIESSKAHHLTLREAMNNRIAESSNLSDSLLTRSDYVAAQNPPLRLTVDGGGSVVYTDGPAYLAALEEQRNAKREAAAKAILDQMNDEGRNEAGSFSKYKEDYVPDAWQPQPQPTPSPGGGGGGGGYGRRSGGGGVGGGAVGAGSGVLSVGSATGLSSAITEWKAPAAGEPGSLSNPISDPSQLSHIDVTTTPVNQRLTPNGPTTGHMPADVLNANDPAWRATPPVGGSVARIAGGTLVAGTAAGVGGLAAARGGVGFSGIGGLATGSSGSALRSVAPAGGVLRPSTMPGGAAGAAGRGGVGGAGMRSGMAPVGSSGSGGAGSRGGAGVAGRGGVGAGGRGGVVGTGGQSGARSAGVAGRSAGVAGRGGGGAGVAGRGAAGRGGAGVAGRGGAAGRGGVSGVVGREGGAGSARGGAGVAGRGGAGVAGRGGAGTAGRGGAGVAGRGGAGTAGRGGVSGVAGREAGAGSARGGAGVAGRGGAGAGGRGGAGVAGRGGAGGRGVLGGGSSAGRGEKKKETQRRNYDVVRIDGIEEQSMGVVGGAAGSADQLKPLSRDSGEDW